MSNSGRGAERWCDDGGVAVELLALVIDSRSPSELARFWARALRWDVTNTASGDVQLVPTDPTGFHLLFRGSTDAKVAQNPIHFDLTSTSIDEQKSSVADLIANGARPADVGQVGDEGHVVLADPEGTEGNPRTTWVVLADPEGNEFCVFPPPEAEPQA